MERSANARVVRSVLGCCDEKRERERERERELGQREIFE